MAGFEEYAGIKKGEAKVTYDAEDHTDADRGVSGKLADKEVKGLLVDLAGRSLDSSRATVHQAVHAVDSNKFQRQPGWWLFWVYILATLGELCLSPVGLSMVSKLAPVKFATMLMGVWMLTSAFGNFAAGQPAQGEIWGTIPPVQFFLIFRRSRSSAWPRSCCSC